MSPLGSFSYIQKYPLNAYYINILYIDNVE